MLICQNMKSKDRLKSTALTAIHQCCRLLQLDILPVKKFSLVDCTPFALMFEDPSNSANGDLITFIVPNEMFSTYLKNDCKLWPGATESCLCVCVCMFACLPVLLVSSDSACLAFSVGLI